MLLTGGLDEVGWGALAGPIVSVVTVFRREDLLRLPSGVTDSKAISAIKRASLYIPLCNAVYDVGVGHAWAWEIDELTPGKALQLSYQRAIEDLRVVPHQLYVDGKNEVRSWKGKQICEPKADFKYAEVSAASIIAKHFRDTMMKDLSKRWPMYGWDGNSGYGTPDHLAAIERHGLLMSPVDKADYQHRKSYCKKLMRR
jgi:ribonuclease HII